MYICKSRFNYAISMVGITVLLLFPVFGNLLAMSYGYNSRYAQILLIFLGFIMLAQELNPNEIFRMVGSKYAAMCAVGLFFLLGAMLGMRHHDELHNSQLIFGIVYVLLCVGMVIALCELMKLRRAKISNVLYCSSPALLVALIGYILAIFAYFKGSSVDLAYYSFNGSYIITSTLFLSIIFSFVIRQNPIIFMFHAFPYLYLTFISMARTSILVFISFVLGLTAVILIYKQYHNFKTVAFIILNVIILTTASILMVSSATLQPKFFPFYAPDNIIGENRVALIKARFDRLTNLSFLERFSHTHTNSVSTKKIAIVSIVSPQKVKGDYYKPVEKNINSDSTVIDNILTASSLDNDKMKMENETADDSKYSNGENNDANVDIPTKNVNMIPTIDNEKSERNVVTNTSQGEATSVAINSKQLETQHVKFLGTAAAPIEELKYDSRTRVFMNGIDVALSHPFGIFPVEYLKFSKVSCATDGNMSSDGLCKYPHNLILELLINFGWIPGLATLVIIIMFLVMAFNLAIASNSYSSMAIVCLYFGYFVAFNTTGNVMDYLVLVLYAVALVINFKAIEMCKKNENLDFPNR